MSSPQVGFAFGVEGDSTLLETIKQLRAEISNLKQQEDQLKGSSEGAARAFGQMGSSAAATRRQMHEAKGEMALIGEEIGLRLPRHVRSFLAEMPGVARLMSAAFSVTAIAILIEYLIELPEKIRSISSSLVGWTTEAKKAYEEQLKLNNAYAEAAENLEKQKRHASESSLQGAARTRQEIKNNEGDVEQLNKQLAETGRSISQLEQKLNPAPRKGLGYYFLPPKRDEISKEERQSLEARLNEMRTRFARLQAQRNELTEVAKPRLEGTEQRESLQERIAIGKEDLQAADSRSTQKAKIDLSWKQEGQKTQLEQDKGLYEQGLISLQEYFNRRVAAAKSGTEAEQAAILAERKAAQTELEGLQALPVGPTAQDQIARKREIETLQERINQLDLAHYRAGQAGERELIKLGEERRKAELDHELKKLELDRQLAELQGNKGQADAIQEKIDTLRDTIELLQLLGPGHEAEVAGYVADKAKARATRTQAEGAQTTFGAGMESIENKRAQLQEQVAAEELQPYQAARKLREEYDAQSASLRQQIEILRELADANAGTQYGDQLGKEADDAEKKLARMHAEIVRQDASWEEWRTEAKRSIDEVSMHMTTGLNGWMMGHQRFGQAVAQSYNSIVMSGVTSLERLGAHWIASHLKMLLVKRTTDAANIASTATSTAAQGGIEKTAGIKSVFTSAKVAAAKAYKAFAEFPPLAIAAAAATFAAVMAFGAFAQGGRIGENARPRVLALAGGGSLHSASGFRSLVDGGRLYGPGTSTSDSIPIMASNGEHVINARAASAIGYDTLDAFNRGDFSALMSGAFLPPIAEAAPYSREGLRRSAGEMEIAPAAAGGPSFHHTTQISGLQALDGASVRAALEEHGELIGKIAVRAVRTHFRQNGVNS